MSKTVKAISHRRFIEHGRYDKKSDAFNGLNTMSPDKAKKMAEIRMRAQKLSAKISKEGIE